MAATKGPDTSAPTPQDNLLSDWRSFRAHLIAADKANVTTFHHTHPSLASQQPSLWAHKMPFVERGCCLLAKRGYKWPSSFAHLNSAVILITDVTDGAVSGILLNRPTRFHVANHASVLARVGDAFKRNLVHLGGDCSTGSLEMLHKLPPSECMGAVQIVPGVSRGGFNASRALVNNGAASPNDFHFFVAYSRWTREQLQAEMEQDAWEVLSCAPDLLIGEHLEQRQSQDDLWKKIMSFVSHC